MISLGVKVWFEKETSIFTQEIKDNNSIQYYIFFLGQQHNICYYPYKMSSLINDEFIAN